MEFVIAWLLIGVLPGIMIPISFLDDHAIEPEEAVVIGALIIAAGPLTWVAVIAFGLWKLIGSFVYGVGLLRDRWRDSRPPKIPRAKARQS